MVRSGGRRGGVTERLESEVHGTQSQTRNNKQRGSSQGRHYLKCGLQTALSTGPGQGK